MSNQSRKYEINSLEDCIEALDAVAEYLGKYEKVRDKLREVGSKFAKIAGYERRSYSFSPSSSSIDRFLDEHLREVLAETLENMSRNVKRRREEVKLTEEEEKEIDKAVSEAFKE